MLQAVERRSSKRRPVRSPHPSEVALLSKEHPFRRAAERAISRCFEREHGAKLYHFLPLLMQVRDGRGRPQSAAGIGLAGARPLFLEVYLDRPVEEHAKRRHGIAVDRTRLAEVGNLAALSPGGARPLFAALTAYLLASGYRWAAYTGTDKLHRGFRRLGMPSYDLGPADGRRLGAELVRWGRYYESKPRVALFDLEKLRAPLLGLAISSPELARLWLRAELEGAPRQ